jgi:hypothetical protein
MKGSIALRITAEQWSVLFRERRSCFLLAARMLVGDKCSPEAVLSQTLASVEGATVASGFEFSRRETFLLLKLSDENVDQLLAFAWKRLGDLEPHCLAPLKSRYSAQEARRW